MFNILCQPDNTYKSEYQDLFIAAQGEDQRQTFKLM